MEYLTSILAVACILALCVILWHKRSQILGNTDDVKGVSGLLAILIISLISNSPVVSVFSVLFIATLITKLKFITEIAAIVFNRSDVLKVIVGQATEPELKTLKTSESSDLLQAENEEAKNSTSHDATPSLATDASPAKDRALSYEKIVGFEVEVLSQLKKFGEYKDYDVQTNRKIQKGNWISIVDAILVKNGAHIVVEIKMIQSKSGLIQGTIRGCEHLRQSASVYAESLRQAGIDNPTVTMLLIIPRLDDDTIKDLVERFGSNDLLILAYDSQTRKFKSYE